MTNTTNRPLPAYADWVLTNPPHTYPGTLPEDILDAEGEPYPADVIEARQQARLALPASTVDAYNRGVADAMNAMAAMMAMTALVNSPEWQERQARAARHQLYKILPPKREAAAERRERECRENAEKWGMAK